MTLDLKGTTPLIKSKPPRETATEEWTNAIQTGETLVTNAGTAELVISSQNSNAVAVQAITTNLGRVFIGDSTVDVFTGWILRPGEAIVIDHDHKQINIYVDSDFDGEGVNFILVR